MKYSHQKIDILSEEYGWLRGSYPHNVFVVVTEANKEQASLLDAFKFEWVGLSDNSRMTISHVTPDGTRYFAVSATSELLAQTTIDLIERKIQALPVH